VIPQRFRSDNAAIVRQFAAIAQRFRSDYEMIAYRLRIDSAAILRELRGYRDAISQ
jgi:hypothetical protein